MATTPETDLIDEIARHLGLYGTKVHVIGIDSARSQILRKIDELVGIQKAEPAIPEFLKVVK